jgi:quinol monooxygenase YgiN
VSAHVITEFHAKAERADELVELLGQVLPDSLSHDGCEAISVQRNQDDRANVISLTQWATRGHYENYLAWRTETGSTATFDEMLTEPMSVRYFDEVRFT